MAPSRSVVILKTGKLEGVTPFCSFLGHDEASIISNVPANWSDID